MQQGRSAAAFTDLSLTIPSIDLSDQSTTALVMIDIQYSDAAAGHGWVKACDAIEPGSMDYYIDRLEGVALPAMRRLLDAFRVEKRPIIHLAIGSAYQDLRDCPQRFRSWTRVLETASGIDDLWWMGNPDYAFRDEVSPLKEETVLRKTSQGAFNGSEIQNVLDRMGIKNLVLAGVVTSCCVETTARDAADRGFGCILVADACADCDQELHDAALKNFGLYFGRVAETEEVISALKAGSSI